jgi:hypothetical protein
MVQEIKQFIHKNFLASQSKEIKEKAQYYLYLIKRNKVHLNEHYLSNLELIGNDR